MSSRRHTLCFFSALFLSFLFWGSVVSRSLPAAAPARVLLCLGDSLTAGYGLDESQAWPALLQQRLDRVLPGWRVVNAGVSGDTTADALKRLNWVLRDRPRVAFVCLGGNDGLRGQDPARIEANLEEIVRRLRGAGVVVYLGGMRMFTSMGPRYSRAFAEVYPRVARRTKAPLLRFLLAGVAGVPGRTQTDGIHPNALGQRDIARTVGAFLLPRLKHLRSRGPVAPSHGPRLGADLKAAP